MKDILNKCYHRKRLLEYFKIAKVLGIKVESFKFSSFLISLNDLTNKKRQERKNFDPIITKISTIDFSTEAEKDLLEEFLNHESESALSHKENTMSRCFGWFKSQKRALKLQTKLLPNPFQSIYFILLAFLIFCQICCFNCLIDWYHLFIHWLNFISRSEKWVDKSLPAECTSL